MHNLKVVFPNKATMKSDQDQCSSHTSLWGDISESESVKVFWKCENVCNTQLILVTTATTDSRTHFFLKPAYNFVMRTQTGLLFYCTHPIVCWHALITQSSPFSFSLAYMYVDLCDISGKCKQQIMTKVANWPYKNWNWTIDKEFWRHLK